MPHTPDTRVFLDGKPAPDQVEHPEHVAPLSVYVKALLALLGLSALGYAVSFAELGAAGLTVSMIIAFAMAAVVVLYFMHLRYEARYHGLFVFGAVALVAVFLAFTTLDLSMRGRLNPEQDTLFRIGNDRDFDDARHVPPIEAAAAKPPAPAKAKPPPKRKAPAKRPFNPAERR